MTTQCFYCKKEFYKDVKILNIVSGSYKSSRTREVNTYHKIIPYHLREKAGKITQGKYFSKQICYDHLSIANDHIVDLSTKKALRWSRITTHPPLFRMKCLKISFIPICEIKSRRKILNIMDNFFLIYAVLISTDIISDLRKIILKLILI